MSKTRAIINPETKEEYTFLDYFETLKANFAFYEFVAMPLTNRQIWRCFKQGLSVRNAFLAGSDVYCGYRFAPHAQIREIL